MKIKKINYSKEEATNLYLNTYRYKILEELKVQEIQKKVLNKILKTTQNDSLDLIFYKNRISGFNLSEMSRLLSKECSIIDINNDDVNDDINNNNINNDDINNDVNNDNININNDNDTNINNTNIDNKKLKKINKYIDIEAECSSESEDIENIEDLSDQSFICDEDIGEDKNPSLYFEQKEQEDEKILRRLKNKFKKRKPNELEKVFIEMEESDEIEQGFSEMDIEIEAVKFNKEEFEIIKEEEDDKFYEESTVEFNNIELIEKKMNKKR